MQFIISIFGIPLGYIMWALYQLVHNYGLALLLFTLIAKLLMIPLGIKQQKSLVKNAIMKPKLDEIQKKYAKNPKKAQEETMKLYEQEHFNPMSSCLPLLIQFPILFGLIDVIYKPLQHILHLSNDVINQAVSLMGDMAGRSAYAVQISVVQAVNQDPEKFASLGADVISQIQSLDLNFLGLNLGATPTFALNVLILIPILSGLTSLLVSLYSMKQSGALSSQGPGTGMTKGMMLVMPLLSAWFAFQVPVGVGLYWIFNNLLSAVQTAILYKVYNPKEMAAKAEAEAAERKERERQEKIEAKKRLKEELKAKKNREISDEELEKAMSEKERNRAKLAAARKRDALKYGEEYVEVTDKDLE